MNETRSTQPPPQSVYVRPPPRRIESARLARWVVRKAALAVWWAFVLLVCSFFAGYSLSVEAVRWSRSDVLSLLGWGGLVVGLAGGTWFWAFVTWRRFEKRFKRLAVRLAKKHKGDRVRAMRSILRRFWFLSGGCPDPRSVVDLVCAYVGRNTDQAELIILGDGEIHPPAENRFESAILRSHGLVDTSRWAFAFVRGAILILLAFGAVAWFGFGLGFVVAIAFVIPTIGSGGADELQWLWRRMICPTYVRIAPRVVQVLRYRCHRRRPSDIRTYEMAPGLVVVLAPPMMVRRPQPYCHNGESSLGDEHRQRAAWLRLLLDDGRTWDRLNIQTVKSPWDTGTLIQDALVSTAKVPQLSDEHLVG